MLTPVWLLIQDKYLPRGKRGGPRKHLGLLGIKLLQNSKPLIEHLLCARPWENRDEKDTVLVLVFNMVRMSDGESKNGKIL